MNIQALNEQPVTGALSRRHIERERVGRVSSEWFSRPDDERYLSLSDLYDACAAAPIVRRPAPWKAAR